MCRAKKDHPAPECEALGLLQSMESHKMSSLVPWTCGRGANNMLITWEGLQVQLEVDQVVSSLGEDNLTC